MTQCYLCGRAMVQNPVQIEHRADIIPICHRARCKDERRIHAKRMNEAKHEFWPIRDRFRRKA